MPCTLKKTIDAIVQSGNHYVAQVKGNQKRLLRTIIRTAELQPFDSQYSCSEKGHGRHSSWHTYVYDATNSDKAGEWTNLQRFIVVRRQRIVGEKISTKEAYFISDLQLNAEQFHQGIRGHWSIENRLHWVKDVVHREDRNKIRTGNGPINVAIFSTIAINIHRKNGNSSITHGQIKFGTNVKELFKYLRT